MRKISSNGKIYYYYYKKKCGRHKKPGPKKKPKKRGRSWQEPWDFKIIGCRFNRQIKYVGIYHNAEEAEYVKKILEEENSKIVFPVKYTNNGRRANEIIEFKNEYLILKKNRQPESQSSVTQLRNEYGKLIDHETSSPRWMVYDKFPWLVEEKFWAYGYNPKNDRKDFNWIYDNFVIDQIKEEYDLVNIIMWNNKIIFSYDFRRFNFVICKNTSDAVRMYNLIEERSKKNKKVIFTGSIFGHADRVYEWFTKIKEKTGWRSDKIYKTETRA